MVHHLATKLERDSSSQQEFYMTLWTKKGSPSLDHPLNHSTPSRTCPILASLSPMEALCILVQPLWGTHLLLERQMGPVLSISRRTTPMHQMPHLFGELYLDSLRSLANSRNAATSQNRSCLMWEKSPPLI